jgi:hypothetical protein
MYNEHLLILNKRARKEEFRRNKKSVKKYKEFIFDNVHTVLGNANS